MTNLRHKDIFLAILVCLLLIMSFSCDRKGKYAGKYVEQGEELSKTSEIELKENGQCVWRILDNETSFSWSIRNNEIRLHNKSGGIILGKIEDDIIEIQLPGSKDRYFRKTK